MPKSGPGKFSVISPVRGRGTAQAAVYLCTLSGFAAQRAGHQIEHTATTVNNSFPRRTQQGRQLRCRAPVLLGDQLLDSGLPLSASHENTGSLPLSVAQA